MRLPLLLVLLVTLPVLPASAGRGGGSGGHGAFGAAPFRGFPQRHFFPFGVSPNRFPGASYGLSASFGNSPAGFSAPNGFGGRHGSGYGFGGLYGFAPPYAGFFPDWDWGWGGNWAWDGGGAPAIPAALPPDRPLRYAAQERPSVETTPEGVTIIRGPGSHHLLP